MLFQYDFKPTDLGSVSYFIYTECEWLGTVFNLKNDFQYALLVFILNVFKVLLHFTCFSFNDAEN